jgi:hypothetical protein
MLASKLSMQELPEMLTSQTIRGAILPEAFLRRENLI